MKGAAIVGWTGLGSIDDLLRTSKAKLPRGAEAAKGARSITVRGEDPVAVARSLAYLPGVEWIAVGYEFASLESCMGALAVLAVRYLREGESFSVVADVKGGGREEGDVLMESTSAVLRAARGARVDERNPRVRFRVISVNDRGACGVQLREGVGGVPTSRRRLASVLVSGGYHSAVTAWMAAVSGYTLTMVHSRGEDDESLRQVARLYAELSRRIDASSIRLTLLEGRGAPGDRLARWLERADGEALTGVHPECRGTRGLELLRRHPKALFPLLLVQEDEVRSRYEGLGLKVKASDRNRTLGAAGGEDRFTERSFGGREADQNAVLDWVLGPRRAA